MLRGGQTHKAKVQASRRPSKSLSTCGFPWSLHQEFQGPAGVTMFVVAGARLLFLFVDLDAFGGTVAFGMEGESLAKERAGTVSCNTADLPGFKLQLFLPKLGCMWLHNAA